MEQEALALLTRSRYELQRPVQIVSNTMTVMTTSENTADTLSTEENSRTCMDDFITEAVLIVCAADVLSLYSHCVYREGCSLLDGVRFTPKGRRCTLEHFKQASHLLNQAIKVTKSIPITLHTNLY